MLIAADTQKQTTKEDKKLLIQVSEFIIKVYDNSQKQKGHEERSFECHSICRAVCLAIPDLRCVDGVYMGIDMDAATGDYKLYSCAHSWLVLQSGSIIDPYPVGILSIGPLLIVNKGNYRVFSGGRYIEKPEALDQICFRKTWRKARVLHKLYLFN